MSGLFITAHRGASGLAPENTLAAFRKAIECNADCAELDVHLSKDGQVVVLHDDDLDRTTTGKGKVWHHDMSQLVQLDAGSWFGMEFLNERIPTLEQVIELCRGNITLNIEIKTHQEQPDLTDRVLQIVRAFNFHNKCVVTSFDIRVIRHIKKSYPELVAGLILNQNPKPFLDDKGIDLFSVQYAFVSKELVNAAHQMAKPVHAWTVNQLSDMKKLIELPVDGIITNFPDRLYKMRSELN